MKNNIFIIFVMTVFSGIISCKKDKTNQIPEATGMIYFHLHTNIDSNEVARYDSIYPDARGRNVSLSLAQLYLSGIALRKTDGSVVKLNNTVILKTLDQEVYLLGTVPAGNYMNVSFDVGLGESFNSRNPNEFTAGSPMGIQNPSMWFGDTSSGYIYVNLQGKIDTSASGKGVPSQPFNFQIGSLPLLKNVRMPDDPFTIPPNESATVHIICDYGELWKNLDWKKDVLTDTYKIRPDLAAKIAGHLPDMFKQDH